LTLVFQVLQSNSVAGSLSHINVMFGSTNSYYTTTRFAADAGADRPKTSTRSVMTKQHLASLRPQVCARAIGRFYRTTL
jgi:hypothetical protein